MYGVKEEIQKITAEKANTWVIPCSEKCTLEGQTLYNSLLPGGVGSAAEQ